ELIFGTNLRVPSCIHVHLYLAGALLVPIGFEVIEKNLQLIFSIGICDRVPKRAQSGLCLMHHRYDM
ncbi:hypothetical protein ACJX0J_012890, partial [Zea mays]